MLVASWAILWLPTVCYGSSYFLKMKDGYLCHDFNLDIFQLNTLNAC